MNGIWARSNKENANIFAQHFSQVFQPNSATNNFQIPQNDANFNVDIINTNIASSYINIVLQSQFNLKKSPKMIKELACVAITILAKLFTAIIKNGSFPNIWKICIIMVLKPGKDKTLPAS